MPETALDPLDYTKRLGFEELKKTRLEAMCNWKKKDVKGIKKNAYIKEIQKKNNKILTVKEKDGLEKLEASTDRLPLLQLRKSIRKFFILVSMFAEAVISTKAFENLSITVILLNSIVMIFDDPKADPKPQFFETVDQVFNGLYLVEMIFKITGLGLIWSQGAYLRDAWNVLDFFIVTSSLPQFLELFFAATEEEVDWSEEDELNQEKKGGGFSVKALRNLRVLRPLRSISSIKGLKVLMQALFAAMPLLGDTLMILLFFFTVFSIAGLQLMRGVLM